MMPYSNGIILDNTNHYGIVKTETVFRFTPAQEDFVNGNITSPDPLEWIYSDDKFSVEDTKAHSTGSPILQSCKGSVNESMRGSDQLSSNNISDIISSRSLKRSLPQSPGTRNKKAKEFGKKHKKGKGKLKKCIFKVFKKGKKGKKRKSKHKKYMVPLILGLLAAKSLLIPIALKALAFISAKGLMMGFFSTMLASVLSLKGMFEHSHAWNRRDDTKTQVEIIQVPSKSDEHVYYDHYKRGDRIPLQVIK